MKKQSIGIMKAGAKFVLVMLVSVLLLSQCAICAFADELPEGEAVLAEENIEQKLEQNQEIAEEKAEGAASEAELNEQGSKAISFEEREIPLVKGASKKLEAVITGEITELVWTSGNEKAAAVDENGEVYAHRIGSAVITCADASDENVFGTITVNVGLSYLSTAYYSHRGDVSAYPQNTIPAFVEAAAEGFTAVEMDIFVSNKANMIVVSHDKAVNGKLCAKITPKNRDEYVYEGYRIPTLQEALAAIWEVNPDCIVELDIKQKGISKTYVKRIINIIGNKRVNICSTSKSALLKFKKWKKSSNTWLVGCTSQSKQSKRTAWIKWCAKYKIKMVSFSSGQLTDTDIRNCHSRKMLVRVRWIFTPEEIEYWMDRGADAFVLEEKLWVD